ncbi:MAG: hypothetical protein HY554_04395, partial [Elusimicrobia bacterium]|nr:hypothetical protein [Elusimicrobiota bacterium]
MTILFLAPQPFYRLRGVCKDCNGASGCVAEASNTDPELECAGVCRVCNGAGSCANATAATDPNSDCPAATCKTGDCDVGAVCGDLGS